MRTKLRSKLMLLFMSLAMVVAIPALALADQVTNNLDNDVDTTLENMPLNAGGPSGTTKIYVNPANGDGKQGCNFGDAPSGTKIDVSVASDNKNVATVSPSSFSLSGCGVDNGQTITVTPVNAGTATISVSGTSSIVVTNNTGKPETRTFSYAQGTFTVTVAGPTNTAPSVSVTGVSDKSHYEYGSVPKAQCSVVDKEDGNKTVDATLSAISGPLASYGLGNQTASCEYTDAGGLKASAAATYEIVDTTAPVIKDAGTNQLANTNGWYNADVTNNFTASDNVALADANQASFSKMTSGEGLAVKVSSGTVKDVVGNEAVAVDSQGFQIDKTAPALSGADINDTTWRNSNLSQNFTASDAMSGLANSADGSFSLTASAESGSASTPTTVSKTVKDAAGNTATRSLSALIDKTAPAPNCGSASTSWLGTDASIACAPTDSGGSGLASSSPTSFNLVTNVPAGTEDNNASTDSRSISDVAGNLATAGPISGNKIDKKAPSLSYVGQTAASTTFNVAGSNGWFISPVQVQFSASDGGSGLASNVTSPFTKESGAAQEGSTVTVASGSVSDAVGNINSGITSPVSFKIDLSDPTNVAFQGIQANQTYAVADLPAQSAISCSADDAISSPADCRVTGYSNAFGSHTLTATATDQAGRPSTRQLTYIVGLKAGEVLSPINSTGKANPLATNLDAFKIKSTIPVKFRLFNDAAMTQLMTNPPAGSVAKLTFFRYNSGTQTEDTVDLINAGTANTDSIFRWNATDSQYIYNLGTSGRTAGTYGVQLTLVDSNNIQLAQSAKYYFILKA